MNLDEILSQLDVEYNVYKYMTIRKEFLNFIAEVNGVFFDSHKAFHLLSTELRDQQNELDKRRNAEHEFEKIEEAMWYVVQERFLERNQAGGSNLRFVGNYCIVTLFQFWEENIRPRIAQVFNVDIYEVMHPLFGDLRNFRNAIIHNHGIATTDVENNEVINWYIRGDLINMERAKYGEFSQAIFGAVLDHQLIPDAANDVAVFLQQYDI